MMTKLAASFAFSLALIIGCDARAIGRPVRIASIASGIDDGEGSTVESNSPGGAAGVVEQKALPPARPESGGGNAGSFEPIRIQLIGEPSSLDPAHLVDQYGITILRNVVQGLFKLDERGAVANGLTESYEVSQDGLTYRFRLKKSAKWSDGRAVTIEDFIYGLRRAVDPRVRCADADSFLAIKQAREIFHGKAPLESLGVKRVGDELVIELARPDPALLSELALPSAGPLRKDLVESNKGNWSTHHPVTGDYLIALQSPEEIELKPNPRTRRRGQRAIVFKLVQEGAEAMRQLENGGLDILTRLPLSSISEMRDKGLLKIVPSTTIFYVAFNMSRPPFNAREWRRAVATVLDRKALEEKLQGTFRAVTSYLPKELDGALPYSPVADPAAAALVKKAIARGKAGKPPVRFAFANSEASGIMAESVRETLSKKLGLEVVPEPSDLKSLLARLSKDPPEMYLLGKTANFNDAITHLASFSNVPDANYSRYRSSEYEHLIDQIRLNPSSAKRIDLARRANLILVDKDVVLVPLLVRFQTFGISPKITGFKASPYQIIQLANLRKK